MRERAKEKNIGAQRKKKESDDRHVYARNTPSTTRSSKRDLVPVVRRIARAVRPKGEEADSSLVDEARRAAAEMEENHLGWWGRETPVPDNDPPKLNSHRGIVDVRTGDPVYEAVSNAPPTLLNRNAGSRASSFGATTDARSRGRPSEKAPLGFGFATKARQLSFTNEANRPAGEEPLCDGHSRARHPML